VVILAQLVYELSFKGAASATLRAAFDDCEVSTGAGTTTLRVAVADSAAMHGMVDRVKDLGLEILELRLVVEPSTDLDNEV
jgi:hypothetical protein